MDLVFSLLIGAVIGFVGGIVLGIILMSNLHDGNSIIALKLSNVINASMLECVTKQVITKEQVHDIEDVFFKHIEINFKHIKANHDDSRKEDK